MIFKKQIKTFICTVLPIGLTPSFFSCSTKINKYIDMSINDSDTVKFAKNISSQIRPVASFPFQLENICQNDILKVRVESQEMDGQFGLFISVCHESHNIVLKNGQKFVNIQFTTTPIVDPNAIKEIHFSISCSLIRSDNTIFKKRFDNLYFENATPTTFDMFSYKNNQNGSKILTGWNEEAWVPEQLALCNVLVIPNDVSEISNDAFCKREGSEFETTIPDNIKFVYLDSCCHHLTSVSALTKIGNGAFAHCKATIQNLNFPPELSYIGEYAFYNCENLCGSISFGQKIEILNQYTFWDCHNITSITFNSPCSLEEGALGQCNKLKTIDVATFENSIPQINNKNVDLYWTIKNNFNGLTPSTISNIKYVYLKNTNELDAWKIFFEQMNEHFGSWVFTTLN